MHMHVMYDMLVSASAKAKVGAQHATRETKRQTVRWDRIRIGIGTWFSFLLKKFTFSLLSGKGGVKMLEIAIWTPQARKIGPFGARRRREKLMI